MALTSGTRIGPYEILGSLGAGGMGEVYRARDSRLGREVALKVLPESVAQDADRLARFRREAQTLAALNHPHIAQIHGLEDGATPAIVMELVEGATLDELIRSKGSLPIDDAVSIARQLAEALETAHEQGVIHRDLKPANIKVRPDGTVKVLDFGLAKALAPAEAGALNQLNSPTITTPAMTAAGMILGTAAYMSPEQARGRVVDRRADIWAFGCVLFEMLSGKRAFEGETVTDTIAAVVTREPEWAGLPAATPSHIRTLLARCFVKDPRQRLRDIGDARIELERPTTAPANASAVIATASTSRPRAWMPWAIATASLAGAIGIGWWALAAASGSSSPRPVRFVIASPVGTGLDVAGTIRSAGVATLSPDGTRLAMLATSLGGRLWIRDLSAIEPVQLRGTDGASQPFWSHDGRSLGYFSPRQLHLVDLASGAIKTLAKVGGARGASMNGDGVVLFADDASAVGGLLRITVSDPTPSPATTLESTRGDTWHGWPVFLPDGRRFLFFAGNNDPAKSAIYLGSLDSTETRLLTLANSNAAYAEPGYLLFARSNTLLAQRFDLRKGEIAGDPMVIAQPIAYNPTIRRAEFSVAAGGMLAYAAGGLTDLQLGWFDRAGKKVGNVAGVSHMDISPDDTMVAADRMDPQTGARDVWVFDQKRGTSTRLTSSPVNDWVPEFSPDGKQIAYTSDHETPGTAQLYVKAANGSGGEQLLLKTDRHKHHLEWSPDGKTLIFESNLTAGNVDLWMVPIIGPREPKPVLTGTFSEAQPTLSPDGRFLAYASNESGVWEVYVDTFPTAGGRWQVSVSGGVEPQFRRDGKEMYYVAADGHVMALDVDLTTPTFGVPRQLFQSTVIGDSTTEHMSVTSDGQRFLLVDSMAAARVGVTVVLNWAAELIK
jgi:serine/threonine protein kinase/Tol biopolymer transport system component